MRLEVGDAISFRCDETGISVAGPRADLAVARQEAGAVDLGRLDLIGARVVVPSAALGVLQVEAVGEDAR